MLCEPAAPSWSGSWWCLFLGFRYLDAESVEVELVRDHGHALLEGIDLGEFLVAEREVEDVEVFRDALGVYRLRDGLAALLDVPTQHDLCRGLAVGLAGFADDLAVQRGIPVAVGALATNGGPDLGEDVVRAVELLQLTLLGVGGTLNWLTADTMSVCSECDGSRYCPDANHYQRNGLSLPELLRRTAHEALQFTEGLPRVHKKLAELDDLGLGYLTLGEATPALSGGEAQRLKLVSQMNRDHSDAVFVLDEPSVGLHPLDVRTLVSVLDALTKRGATVIVIEHDLDLIADADYVIDLGPGGGEDGGEILATGTPTQVADSPQSVTGRYLARRLGN